MADEVPAPQPPLPSWAGERQHSFPGRGILLSTAFGKKPTRNSDPELGLGSAPNKAAGVPPGYPRMAVFLAYDDHFMLCLRFGELQARLLRQRDEIEHLQRDEIEHLQRELEELDDLDVRDGQPGGDLNTRNQREQFRKRLIRITLQREIIKTLSAYREYMRDHG